MSLPSLVPIPFWQDTWRINDVRIRNIDKDTSSNNKGRTHLSIKIELALCLQLAQPMAIEKSLWSASYNCRWWASGSQYVHDFYLSVTYCVYKLKLPHMLGTQLHFCMKYGSCTKATYTYEWIASYFFTPFPSCSLVTLIYIYILLSCDIVIRQEIASIT